MQKKIIGYFNLFLLVSTLNACGYLEVYQAKIKQGNILNAHQITQLEIGMSKQAVKKILGSPVMIDIFHDNSWVYTNNSSEQNYRLELFFRDNQLHRIVSHNLLDVIDNNTSEDLKEKIEKDKTNLDKFSKIQQEQFRIRLEESIKNVENANKI